MRFAKIVRFGRTRTDVGVDVNNLFNTSYATGLQPDVYPGNRPGKRRQLRAATERLGLRRPSLVFPRFVRLNFTVNF